jgi:hypothetical protein
VAIRTTDKLVLDTLEEGVEDDTKLNVHIRRANRLTDWLQTQDAADQGMLNDGLLQEIETLLACHFYSTKDQPYTSKSTNGASGSFQGQYGMHLERTMYGQDAIVMDVSGKLATLGKRTRARLIWGGKAADSPRPDGEDL